MYLASLRRRNRLHGTYFGAYSRRQGEGVPPLKAVRDPTEQKRKAKTEKQREETDKTKVMNGG